MGDKRSRPTSLEVPHADRGGKRAAKGTYTHSPKPARPKIRPVRLGVGGSGLVPFAPEYRTPAVYWELVPMTGDALIRVDIGLVILIAAIIVAAVFRF